MSDLNKLSSSLMLTLGYFNLPEPVTMAEESLACTLYPPQKQTVCRYYDKEFLQEFTDN